MKTVNYLALTIAIIGAVNWGLIGLLNFDLVAFIFGEMTFYPASGLGKFDPDEWDIKMGEWLTLPNKNC